MPITDLTNTKWLLNETLEPMSEYDESIFGWTASYNINFTANDTEFKRFEGEQCENILEGNIVDELRYYYTNPHPYVHEVYYWFNDSSWLDEVWRTITITGGDDATNPDLIAWLEANAKLVEEEPAAGTTISYNGTVIATIQPGETATLECAGKQMDDNIVVEVAETSGSGSGGVEIPLRTITYAVGEGFNTVKLRYMTVENGSLIVKETEASANSNGSISLLSGAGCDIESTPVTNAWTGEESYPNIETNTGRYVGANGSDYSIIHISGMDLDDHLEITA